MAKEFKESSKKSELTKTETSSFFKLESGTKKSEGKKSLKLANSDNDSDKKSIESRLRLSRQEEKFINSLKLISKKQSSSSFRRLSKPKSTEKPGLSKTESKFLKSKSESLISINIKSTKRFGKSKKLFEGENVKRSEESLERKGGSKGGKGLDRDNEDARMRSDLKITLKNLMKLINEGEFKGKVDDEMIKKALSALKTIEKSNSDLIKSSTDLSGLKIMACCMNECNSKKPFPMRELIEKMEEKKKLDDIKRKIKFKQEKLERQVKRLQKIKHMKEMKEKELDDLREVAEKHISKLKDAHEKEHQEMKKRQCQDHSHLKKLICHRNDQIQMNYPDHISDSGSSGSKVNKKSGDSANKQSSNNKRMIVVRSRDPIKKIYSQFHNRHLSTDPFFYNLNKWTHD